MVLRIPKIFFECPNCHEKTTIRLSGSLSPVKLQNTIKDSTYCKPCLDTTKIKVQLKVVGFDWEKESTNTNTSNVPTNIEKNQKVL